MALEAAWRARVLHGALRPGRRRTGAGQAGPGGCGASRADPVRGLRSRAGDGMAHLGRAVHRSRSPLRGSVPPRQAGIPRSMDAGHAPARAGRGTRGSGARGGGHRCRDRPAGSRSVSAPHRRVRGGVGPPAHAGHGTGPLGDDRTHRLAAAAGSRQPAAPTAPWSLPALRASSQRRTWSGWLPTPSTSLGVTRPRNGPKPGTACTWPSLKRTRRSSLVFRRSRNGAVRPSSRHASVATRHSALSWNWRESCSRTAHARKERRSSSGSVTTRTPWEHAGTKSRRPLPPVGSACRSRRLTPEPGR